MWRLVIDSVATLNELHTTWSLDDVLKANALLDMRSDLESISIPKAKEHR